MIATGSTDVTEVAALGARVKREVRGPPFWERTALTEPVTWQARPPCGLVQPCMTWWAFAAMVARL